MKIANKYILILCLIALPFFLTGCTTKTTTQTKTTTETKASSDTKAVQNIQTTPNSDKFVLTTIRDAVLKQVALKCEYFDEDNVKIDTYIKGRQVYMESEQPNKDTGNPVIVKGIIKGDKFYAWGEENNKGILMNFSTMKEGEGASMGGQKVKSVDDVINVLESKKESCSVTTIADSKFVVPDNVDFQEF